MIWVLSAQIETLESDISSASNARFDYYQWRDDGVKGKGVNKTAPTLDEKNSQISLIFKDDKYKDPKELEGK